MRKSKIKQVNSFYEAQSDFNKQIMDLNPKESLKFFNKFHESVLNALFIEQNGEKYQKLHEDFYDIVELALIGNVSLFPTEWSEATIERTAKYHDETMDLKRLLNLYPTIMEFRNSVIGLINPKLTKEEIKEKEKFIKEIYDKLNENPHILGLFKFYLTPEDYRMYVEYPLSIYKSKILNN